MPPPNLSTGTELLMTLLIAALAVGLISLQILDSRAHHRDNQRRQDMAVLQRSVARYYALHGFYPARLTITNNDYQYKAFAKQTAVSVDSKANCDNKVPKRLCDNYVLYTDRMETVDNPYLLRSY